MEVFSAIIVVVPLPVPIAEEFSINPSPLEIGYLTPSVGMNLFIGLLLIALLLITYLLDLSLWLPRLRGKTSVPFLLE